MSTWPPPEIATYRMERERTPFERVMQPRPAAPAAPDRRVADALMPPSGVPILWCRCGSAIELERMRNPATNAERQYLDAWPAMHAGAAHRVVRDSYRAACKPFIGGCRNCGQPVGGRKQFYCSDQCREVFDEDHFWNSASAAVMGRQAVYAVSPARGKHPRAAIICARCAEPIHGTAEVNHVVPVNGVRPFFGCQHHQANLEVLDHKCHLVVTGEQRAAGLIGRRAV